ncbi:unnamed protein product [Phytophthora lilii]|uniref:Unnamed protein product n=1 Tax=Phytophthora lilii TaxID=2077276 RepID=A0A9W6TGD5_9STRA|nr:unnamed protein product [Phytophthora lilii]
MDTHAGAAGGAGEAAQAGTALDAGAGDCSEYNGLLTEWLTRSDGGQFKQSPLVEKLSSHMQFHGLGNMIYNNAGGNDEEVQKALHMWKIAMDKVAKAGFSVDALFALIERLDVCTGKRKGQV